MKEFTAACVQIAITPNDVQANVEKGVSWLEKAGAEKCLLKNGSCGSLGSDDGQSYQAGIPMPII